MEKPDGGELLATLLRSGEWLKAQKAETGSTIRLTFAELGIDGPADVLAVDACPIIESGTGRVVTGTFRHSAANVSDLYVTSDDQSIGTTANHPFWSETRQDFVQAGTLQPGEKLRTATGASAHVRQLIPRPRSAEVFNLEVDAEHCYAVGRNGVVVHNSDNYNDGPPNLSLNRMRGTPKNLGPFGSKAPHQVTPGIRELEGHYINNRGYSQPWRAYYDHFGRLIGRTDFNASNRAAGIPDIHHHTCRWGPGMTPMETGSHLPGEFTP